MGTALENLKAARKLLETSWTSGRLSRRGDASFCAMGALSMSKYQRPAYTEERDTSEELGYFLAALKACPKDDIIRQTVGDYIRYGEQGNWPLFQWAVVSVNDILGKAETLRFFDAAICIAEQEERDARKLPTDS